MWEYFLFHVRQNSRFGVKTAVLLRIKSSGMLSLGFIVLGLLAPWQGFQRVRALSKLPPYPLSLGSAVDVKVTTGILTGYVDHSAGVGGRLRCIYVIIGSKFYAGPSVDILGKYRYIVTPCKHLLLKLGNSVVCTDLRKGKYRSFDKTSVCLLLTISSLCRFHCVRGLRRGSPAFHLLE
jgi:hypothetical protein